MNPWNAQTIRLDTVDSTNTYAKALARQGAPHGAVILADHQTDGRGRLSRTFSSPAGLGLYCSVILRPDRLLHLTPIAAEAARRAIVSATGLEPSIKWINDLMLNGKKLCGILTELAGDSFIVGIGINCNQKPKDFPLELQAIATSLSQEAQRPIDRTALTEALLTQLHTMSQILLQAPTSWLDQYRAHCLTLGQSVQLIQNGQIRQAHADTMDDHGALLVTLPDGTQERIFSGEVSVRGLYGYL